MAAIYDKLITNHDSFIHVLVLVDYKLGLVFTGDMHTKISSIKQLKFVRSRVRHA